jgi:aminomethyltransferase
MKVTALFDAHKGLDAKIVPFAGYEMPVSYKLGAIKEHLWVRKSCGLFDVSHMGQIIISGDQVEKLLSIITPTNFINNTHYNAKYTVLLSDNCTILDDLIITKITDNKYFVVINASRKDFDISYIKKYADKFLCNIEILDKSLLAVQGPKSEQILSKLLSTDLSTQKYMSLQELDYLGENIFISRLGYTGEDGFEISISNKQITKLWNDLLLNEQVKPIGLAARDSLRLEMGYPLYGNDLNDTINLANTSLKWVINSKEGYLGKKLYNDKPSQKRVGVKLLEKGVARDKMEIFNLEKKKIGILTSAGYSPSLNISIGQAYIDIENAVIGKEVLVKIRDKFKQAQINKISFLSSATKK